MLRLLYAEFRRLYREVNTHFELSHSGLGYLSAKPMRQTLAWSWHVAVCVETVILKFSYMEQGSIISQAVRATNRESEPTLKEFYVWYNI